jgi:phosphate transport system substrate-binding protein
MSKEGQMVIEDTGYVAVSDNVDEYTASNLEGTITVAGSTSVALVMEILAEQYKKLNKNVNVEIQQIGSSAGIQGVKEGTCDIGMTSRELKDKEDGGDIKLVEIAKDGIAVIVNKNNEINDLSKEQVRKIFAGEVKEWNEFR